MPVMIPDSPLRTDVEWVHYYGTGSAAVFIWMGVLYWNDIEIKTYPMTRDGDRDDALRRLDDLVADDLKKILR